MGRSKKAPKKVSFSEPIIPIKSSETKNSVGNSAKTSAKPPTKASPRVLEQNLPRICLNMIVKNEAHIIHECLNSVAPFIDYWIISDTGSTDGTQDIIRNLFKEKNIPGELFEDPWKEFGPSRTKALDHCKGKAQFAWVIDADDYLVGNIVFPEVMNQDGYEISYRLGDLNFCRHQVFRVSSSWKYIGVRHEAPLCNKEGATTGKIGGDYYVQARTMGDRSKDPLKYLHDAQVIQKALLNEPNNTRYMFYCAQSFRDAGPDYRTESIRMYKKRISKGGFPEEIFLSYLEIARHYRAMKRTPDEIREFCLGAFKALPDRSESLYELSTYNRQIVHDYPTAYLYAKKAAYIPFPEHLKLFLVERIYRYDAKINLAVCALLLGKKEEAIKECEALIAEAQIRNIPENRLNWIRNLRISMDQTYVPSSLSEKITIVTLFPEGLDGWINYFQRTTTDYIFFPGMDQIGNDLCNQIPNTFDRCIDRCQQNPICLGFNTWGYLKYDLKIPSDFVSPDLFRPSDGLYLHRKKYLEHLMMMKYPQKNLLKDWKFFPKRDSVHGDLNCQSTLSMQELAQYVLDHPEAIGFNTRGWTKHYIKSEENLQEISGFCPIDGLYVHPGRFTEQQLLMEGGVE